MRTFLRAAKATYGPDFRIRLCPTLYQAKHFLGKIEIGTNEAVIIFDRSGTQCWRRFVMVKELCHLVFSEDSRSAEDSDVDSLLSAFMAGVLDMQDNMKSPEFSAMLMALEVLLPHSERDCVTKMISEGASYHDVAVRYKVPQQQVHLYLSSHYSTLMDKTYELRDKTYELRDRGMRGL